MTARRGMGLDEAAAVVRQNPMREGERFSVYLERLAVLCGYMQPGSGVLPATHDWESAGAVAAAPAADDDWWHK